jgi:uncharacterized membrane protein
MGISDAPLAPPPPAAVPKPPSSYAAPPVPVPEKKRDSGDLNESANMGQFLGIAAVVCFILAASFIVKLSIDSGWLNYARQVGLAAALGITLIVVGVWGRKSDNRYLALLPAGGVVVLYLAAMAGNAFYGLYPAEVAVVAISSVSVLSIYLFTLFRSDGYVGIAVVGSYFASLLLGTTVEPALLIAYFLIWDCTFGLLSVLLKSRTMLLIAAYIGLGLSFVSLQSFGVFSNALEVVVVVQLIQFLIFLGSLVGFAVYNREPLRQETAWAFFPLILFFYGIEYSLISRLAPDYVAWIALGFAGVVYAAYALSKKALGKESLGSSSTVTAFVSLVLLHALYFEILPARGQIWAGPVLLLALPFLLARFDTKGRHWPVTLCVAFVVLLGFVRSIAVLESIPPFEVIAIQALYFLAFGALYLRKEIEHSGDLSILILALAHSQFLIGVYRVWVQAVEILGLSAEVGRFCISITWGLFAVVTLLWAKRSEDKAMGYSSLGILAAATLKVFLWDVASSSPVVRIFCLLGMGIILYFCGFQLRSIGRWKRG